MTANINPYCFTWIEFYYEDIFRIIQKEVARILWKNCIFEHKIILLLDAPTMDFSSNV